MSSTNKTTNYELSQFIGTDKPTFLGDYNGDMLKIDTQMKANADAITSASTTANTANQNASSALETANTANTNATTALETANSASSSASSANVNAQTALNTATQNAQLLSALQQYLNLNNFNEYSLGSGVSGQMKIASNNDGTLCKIYGRCYYQTSGAWQQNFTVQNTLLRPQETITIQNAGIVLNNVDNESGIVNISISPNGNITFNCTHGTNVNARFYVYLFPCMYFMDNFGDTPQQ